jgi:hypothetical protein
MDVKRGDKDTALRQAGTTLYRPAYDSDVVPLDFAKIQGDKNNAIAIFVSEGKSLGEKSVMDPAARIIVSVVSLEGKP